MAGNLETERNLLGKLTQRPKLDTQLQGRVRESVTMRMHTHHDPHLIFAQIGEGLDFLPENTVAKAFVSIWCDVFPERVDEMWSSAVCLLPGGHFSEQGSGPSAEEIPHGKNRFQSPQSWDIRGEK